MSSSGILELYDFITFSFNEGISQNMVDRFDFFIGDIDFSSSDENIILKGDIGVHRLNSIEINPSIDSQEYGDIYGYKISLPPELEISFVDNLIDNPDNYVPLDGIIPQCILFESGPGQACEALADCIVQDDFYVPFKLDNCFDDDTNCKTLQFAVSNGCPGGEINFPSKVLKYINQSTDNSPSIASNLRVEPILSHPDLISFDSDIFIKDNKFSYLDAVTFYSENHNRILLNDANFLTNGNIRIHDLSIKNADNPILEPNDTISISLEYTNCIWADNIYNEIEYPSLDLELLSNLSGNPEFDRDKDLVLKL